MIWAGITFVVSSLFDCAIIGTAVAFLCSKPKQIISLKRLATICLIIFVIGDILGYLCLNLLGLTITTNNETLISFLGTNDLSEALMPSFFSMIDLLFYAIQVAVAVLCGRLIVGRYRKKYSAEETSKMMVAE